MSYVLDLAKQRFLDLWSSSDFLYPALKILQVTMLPPLLSSGNDVGGLVQYDHLLNIRFCQIL